MWQKFKSLNLLMRIIIACMAICFLPITLVIFSIEFLVKAIRNKNKGKVVLGCFLALITMSCTRSIYFTNRDLDNKDSVPVKQVSYTDNNESKNKTNEEKEEKTQEEVKKKEEVKKGQENNVDNNNDVGTNIKNEIKTMEKGSVLDVQYTQLDENNKIVVIKMQLLDNFSPKDMLKSGFLSAKNIIKATDEKYSSSITQYQFWFVANLIDSSGNKDEQKVLSFEYSRSTLQGINWVATTTDEFMNMAENVWLHPAFNN
ncbi:TPA: hypothetical protein ACXJNV_000568 [Clostridioides difficile]|uniref:hypothetical protein n=1 Tax=Clostridioides difficile TaxID=1496 RepID=UPI00093A15DE|nr:hypothetical protein [Clostridioides difficile]MBY1383073.1 hypothetical protein [Clostridioides difficile]MCR1683246.1 hypothetical protein [Clostridioides difficile]GMK81705.1 hypothetical protein JSCD7_00720 [Clostridioides difficile]HBE8440706.1 hypothetical protein [Clostridioides difficile]HBE9331467.1 hypothetical protein [Clostridioides difficile]